MRYRSSATIVAVAGLLLPSGPVEAKPARHYKTLSGHKNFVVQVAVTPDGKQAVTVSQDGTARLWSLPGGAPVLTIAAGEDETPSVVAIDPSGKHVAIGIGSAARLYSVEKRKATRLHDLSGHKNEITALALDKEGSTVASAGDGVRVWATSTGKEIAKIAADKTATDVKFSPATGEIVAVLGDGIHFFGRSTFKEARKIAREGLHRFAFSANGKRLAAVSRDGKLVALDSAGGVLWTQDKAASDTYPALSSDGKLVLAGFTEDRIVAHDAETGEMRWYVSGESGITVLAVGGKVLVTGAGETTVWLWKMP